MPGKRILVVDDEQQIVRLCTKVLSDLGYTVHGENGGQRALAQLERTNFDLLIVDIKMPEMDGLSLLRRAREMDPNLTAVVITGYATLDRSIEALQAGARGFLLKPFDFDDLISTVEAALTQREREQETLRLRAQLPILEISQALMAEGDVDSLANRLLDVVVREIGARQASILLLDKEHEELYLAAAVGISQPTPDRLPLPEGSTPLRQALSAETPLVLDAQARIELEPLLQPLAPATDGDTLVLAPLRTSKAEIGLLGLSRTPPAADRPQAMASSGDLNLLSIMTGQIAIALENARLYALEQQRITELARALEQQRELDLLKNEFMRNVSHELRTPLTMIMGYAELLVSGELGKIQPEQRGPLGTLLSQARALYDLVDNITALLQNENRQPLWESCCMRELLQASLGDFQVLADQSGVRLDAELTAPTTEVLGDFQHLRRVVDNLIGNALKFTPKGGTITVRLHNRDGQVMLQVQDTGIGIAPEHQDQIFDRFYQVDGTIRRQYGGSGLGLALVKEIVATHGGAVTVESREGQGSTFTVSLPPASVTCPEGDHDH